MQENYISLDPDNAESMTSQQRSRVWSQRVTESCGGEAGEMFGNQCSITAMLCTYTMMRGKGFRLTPFSPVKIGSVAGLIGVGFIGRYFGTHYAAVNLGDYEQYSHLMQQKRAIIAGTVPLDGIKQ